MIHLTCYHYCRLAYCLTPVVKRIDKNALRIFPHSLHPSLEEVILIDKDMLNSVLHYITIVCVVNGGHPIP